MPVIEYFSTLSYIEWNEENFFSDPKTTSTYVLSIPTNTTSVNTNMLVNLPMGAIGPIPLGMSPIFDCIIKLRNVARSFVEAQRNNGNGKILVHPTDCYNMATYVRNELNSAKNIADIICNKHVGLPFAKVYKYLIHNKLTDTMQLAAAQNNDVINMLFGFGKFNAALVFFMDVFMDVSWNFDQGMFIVHPKTPVCVMEHNINDFNTIFDNDLFAYIKNLEPGITNLPDKTKSLEEHNMALMCSLITAKCARVSARVTKTDHAIVIGEMASGTVYYNYLPATHTKAEEDTPEITQAADENSTQILNNTEIRHGKEPQDHVMDLHQAQRTTRSFKNTRFHNSNSEKYNNRILYHLEKTLAICEKVRIDELEDELAETLLFFFQVLEIMLNDRSLLTLLGCDMQYVNNLLESEFWAFVRQTVATIHEVSHLEIETSPLTSFWTSMGLYVYDQIFKPPKRHLSIKCPNGTQIFHVFNTLRSNFLLKTWEEVLYELLCTNTRLTDNNEIFLNALDALDLDSAVFGNLDLTVAAILGSNQFLLAIKSL